MDLSPSYKITIQHQFESFCKRVIWGERCEYLRTLLNRAEKESNYSDLPPALLDRLCAENSDPAEQYVFDAYGFTVPIRNDRLAECLLELGYREYSILLLYYSLGMSDGEISTLVGLSRSRVQHVRNELLSRLKKHMKE